MKNTSDSIYGVYLMNGTSANSTQQALKKERQMMRSWAVKGRRDYGVNSVKEYCRRYRYEGIRVYI